MPSVATKPGLPRSGERGYKALFPSDSPQGVCYGITMRCDLTGQSPLTPLSPVGEVLQQLTNLIKALVTEFVSWWIGQSIWFGGHGCLNAGPLHLVDRAIDRIGIWYFPVARRRGIPRSGRPATAGKPQVVRLQLVIVQFPITWLRS